MTRPERPGFGGGARPGRRPAVVVVDMSCGFTDPSSPLACDLDNVVEAIAGVLELARSTGHPVIYTTVAYGEAGLRTARAFLEKVPALATLAAGSPWTAIDPRLAPADGEPVVTKLWASAFFGTPLASLLVSAEIDTLVVTGASTSGCVRATAVDSLQHGYRTLVPRECVGDRDASAHDSNLRDLQTKYAQVVATDDVLNYLSDPVDLAKA